MGFAYSKDNIYNSIDIIINSIDNLDYVVKLAVTLIKCLIINYEFYLKLIKFRLPFLHEFLG